MVLLFLNPHEKGVKMNGNRLVKIWRSVIVTLSVLFLLASLPLSSLAEESGEFTGTWIANGTREIFPFGEERDVYTFTLSGHVNLQTTIGKKKDYWSECVGMSDSETGSVARCVWHDLDGPKIYITLQTDQIKQDVPVRGSIIGGSEQLKGISGDLSFIWSSVTFQKDGNKTTVTGQALDLHGRYQIP